MCATPTAAPDQPTAHRDSQGKATHTTNTPHRQPSGNVSRVEECSSPYLSFNHEDWGRLRAGTPLPLTEHELADLRGINEQVSLDEVVEIYLPLSRLLNLYVAATQDLYKATATFLDSPIPKVPYIIGVAGSVAVGKSTTSRILQALLRRWPNHPKVDLVTTDGFLHSNAVLEERGLMDRKGFPESYDVRQLFQFVLRVKSGERNVEHPIYSHITYDIIPDEARVVDQPDIVIVEGLNVLQTKSRDTTQTSRQFLSDLFDFSIYVDALPETIERWYVERFLSFRSTAFRSPDAYFRRYANLTEQEAIDTACSIWKRINEPNLLDNIQPTRERAQLILHKGPDHAIQQVRLRKL